ncbi:uncharacterized protein LOC117331187 [Pecten maximus]|uniref:uncharacterized protein LOC117331187 n=1 Tax=Pecten maximus TaxID=6579 RepID=UPI0014587C32|nr:uncharacterized protein LOC117331187 [Pecten maximus]
METLIKDVDGQLQYMTQHQDIALKSLAYLRRKINERFDQLQKELTDKLTKPFKKENSNLDISKLKCERLMFAMQNTLTSSTDTALKDDTVGTICLFQRGQAELESCKELIKELEGSSQSTRLSHEYDSKILALGTKKGINMGMIAIHQLQRKLPSTLNCTPFYERQLKKTKRLNIKVASDENNCCALGVLLMSGGRIVVGDYANKKVKLFTENGKFQCEVGLADEPCDMCRIDENTVAVTLINSQTICIVNVVDSTLTLASEIEIPDITGKCLIVGTKTALYGVSQNGGEATKLREIGSRCLHLASNQKNGHVFASIASSVFDQIAVTRLSDGTHTDVLKVGVVDGTTGIDVDREGNVYICGGNSGNVIQMSGDGTNVRELLTSSDGIKDPRAMSVLGDTLVVTSESAEVLKLV